MRPLDPRLPATCAARARRARGRRRSSGSSPPIALLAQATLFASIVARAFDGIVRPDRSSASSLFGAVVIARALFASGFEATGRRAAALVMSELRLALVERRLSVRHVRWTGPRPGRSQPRRSAGRRRAGGLLRALPPAAGAGGARSHRGACLDGGDRPDLSRDHAGDAAVDPGVHGADRPVHRVEDPGTMGGAGTALEPLPRRRPGPPNAPSVQPWRLAGGSDRGGERGVPANDDGDAPRELPVRSRARSGGDVRDGARGGHARRPADRGIGWPSNLR